jgi:hypothetical protein
MRPTAFIFAIGLLLAAAVAAQEVQWIPAAASNPGLQGTVWTTDLWLYSRVVDAPINVYAAFLPGQAGNESPTEITIVVPQETAVEINDAVATLFGESRPGAIRLRSEYPFWAQSKTTNDGGAAGSYGQGIPSFSAAQAVNGSILLGAANRPGGDGVRTNVGFVNAGSGSGEVQVGVYDDTTGSPIGSTRVELGPNGWFQGDVFALVGAADQTVDHATVHALMVGSGELLPIAYLSRVDNRSGDGTFIAGLTGETIRILSRAWEVVLTLTATAGVTLDQLVYTGTDGTDVTIETPASGFTTGTLEFMSPATFCYTAQGHADASGGQIVGEVLAMPEGGQQSLHRTGAGLAGEGPVTVEHCVTLD